MILALQVKTVVRVKSLKAKRKNLRKRMLTLLVAVGTLLREVIVTALLEAPRSSVMHSLTAVKRRRSKLKLENEFTLKSMLSLQKVERHRPLLKEDGSGSLSIDCLKILSHTWVALTN
jgi:hypothetical protein